LAGTRRRTPRGRRQIYFTRNQRFDKSEKRLAKSK
jgi:hypothetical protein